MGTFAIAKMQPDPSSLKREDALYMAKLAEQAERYDDMVKYMRRIVDLGIKADELSVEERNLLSVGYKNMMSVRRTAWRTVQQYEEKGGTKCPPELITQYKDTISKEVFDLITEVITNIVNVFVDGPKKAKDVEVLVFFRKMEGDYNRYGAEISTGAVRDGFKNDALAAYAEAEKLANEHLPSTNPIRLGLALNFSVFYYEICDE